MENLEILEAFSLYLKEKKSEGKKVIAFIAHDNIPEELIDAADFIPLRLIFAGNDELMDASHEFLPPSTCAFAQTCIGIFSLKSRQYEFLELIDYFIVSNHCVSDICASEIICKYFNIPRLNFYISYLRNDNSEQYFKIELLEFKKEMEKIVGSDITDEKLIASIKKYNKFRKSIEELNSLEIRGSEKLKLMQKAFLFGPNFLPELREFININKNSPKEKNSNSIDLLLTGCSIFINDTLINLIEEAGGNIIFFDTWLGYNYFSQIFNEDLIKSTFDPIDLLALRFRNNIYGDHSVPNFLQNRIAHIEEIYNSYKKKTGKRLGIVNHIIKFCDHISIMSSFLKNKLQEKGIQVLNIERDYSRAIRGQLSTRIEAYLEMLAE